MSRLPWIGGSGSGSAGSHHVPCTLVSFLTQNSNANSLRLGTLRGHRLLPHVHCSNKSSGGSAALMTQHRHIIVPRQLKAYGGTFSLAVGDRAGDVPSDVVLQSLSPARLQHHASPLFSGKAVKTKTVDQFEDMLLLEPALLAYIKEKGLQTPSPIQQTAIEVIVQQRLFASPALAAQQPQQQQYSLQVEQAPSTSSSSEKSVLIAAPHGEGKTLSFLLPLYQNMLKDRDVYKIPLRERRPRLILLAPTRELILQLHAICRELDAKTGLKSISFTSKKRSKYHLSRLLKEQGMADVVIMHPKALLALIRSRRLFLDDLRYVAVDEADTMLSSQHDHAAVQLLMKIKKRNMYKYLWPVQTQYVFSTSYITRKLEYVLGQKFPSIVPCMHRQSMHRPAAALQHRFIAMEGARGEEEKWSVLLRLLHKHRHVPVVRVDTEKAEQTVLQQPVHLTGTLSEWRQAHAELYRRHGAAAAAAPGSGDEGAQSEGDGATGAVVSSAATSPPDAVARRSHDGGDGPYAEDVQARYALEHIRPVHWGYLTTIAAPFTCPVGRTTFAPGARTIIFFATIDAATALYYQLRKEGYAVSLLHAALPNPVRRQMYDDFASGRTNILCATDIAARGLDVHVDVVINFTMPSNALTYLSRAGRAARMGRQGKVYSLYTKQQGVVVTAVRAFLRRDLPLEGITNHKQHMTQPRYAEWRSHKVNALSRAYVSMIATKTIPAHLEKTYLHHNATWRPLFRPQGAAQHAGVPVQQQQKLMDRVMEQAVSYRKEQLARRKGGRAKFGRRLAKSGVWNDIGGIASREVANAQQSESPGGVGLPSGPPN